MQKERIEQIKKDLNDVILVHNIGIMKIEGEEDADKRDMAIACDRIYYLTEHIPVALNESNESEMEAELEEVYQEFKTLRDRLNY